MNDEALLHVRAVKSRHEAALMRKANVVGVGIGMCWDDENDTSRLAIIVNVTHKVPHHRLAKRDVVPDELEDVPVKIQAVGAFRAHQGPQHAEDD